MGQWHPAEPALPRCPPPPPAVAVGHVYLAAARHPLLRPHEPPHQLVVPQRLAAAEGDPLPRPLHGRRSRRRRRHGHRRRVRPGPARPRGRRRPRRCGRAATATSGGASSRGPGRRRPPRWRGRDGGAAPRHHRRRHGVDLDAHDPVVGAQRSAYAHLPRERGGRRLQRRPPPPPWPPLHRPSHGSRRRRRRSYGGTSRRRDQPTQSPPVPRLLLGGGVTIPASKQAHTHEEITIKHVHNDRSKDHNSQKGKTRYFSPCSWGEKKRKEFFLCANTYAYDEHLGRRRCACTESEPWSCCIIEANSSWEMKKSKEEMRKNLPLPGGVCFEQMRTPVSTTREGMIWKGDNSAGTSFSSWQQNIGHINARLVFNREFTPWLMRRVHASLAKSGWYSGILREFIYGDFVHHHWGYIGSDWERERCAHLGISGMDGWWRVQ